MARLSKSDLSSQGFGVLKLLALLPEITHTALIAGLARERENEAEGFEKNEGSL